MRFMKIPKEQWQKWASDYAEQNVITQVAAFKCMLEAAMMCGFDMVEEMKRAGFDTSEAYDLKKRRKELADSMSQLLREAFPPNDKLSHSASEPKGTEIK